MVVAIVGCVTVVAGIMLPDRGPDMQPLKAEARPVVANPRNRRLVKAFGVIPSLNPGGVTME
jgi:hypothetical protein